MTIASARWRHTPATTTIKDRHDASSGALVAPLYTCRSSQRMQHLQASAWPIQAKYQRRRPTEAFRHLHPGSARHSSSWLKSTTEYLFSDTLDEKVEVGIDSAGNRYYEIVRTFRADNSKQSLRVVEPESGATAADYDPTTVPPQWQSWLSYSRRDPPVTDELGSLPHIPTPEASTEDDQADSEEEPPSKSSIVRL
jgi:NADH:ubiquinone oxidoreductase subunit